MIGLGTNIYPQLDKPLDNRLVVATYLDIEFLTSHGYVYPSMEIYVTGESKTYRYSGSAWEEITDVKFDTSINTTVAVGHIPINTDLNNKTWQEIFTSMFYAASIHSFNIYTTTWVSSYNLNYGSALLNGTRSFRFKLNVPNTFIQTGNVVKCKLKIGTIESSVITITVSNPNDYISGSASFTTLTESSRVYSGSILLYVQKTDLTWMQASTSVAYSYRPQIYSFKHSSSTLEAITNLIQTSLIQQTVLENISGITVKTLKTSLTEDAEHVFAETETVQYLYFILPDFASTYWKSTTQIREKISYQSIVFTSARPEDYTLKLTKDGIGTTTLDYKVYRSDNPTSGALTAVIT